MRGRIVELSATEHRQVEALLPWYVRGALGPQDHARVESHLADCARCQAALAAERGLQATHAAIEDPRGGDVEQGLAQMRLRIAASSANGAGESALVRWRRAWREGPRGWRWAVAAQGAGLLALGLALGLTLTWWPAREPSYRALGNPAAPSGGQLVVRFRPEVTEAQMRRVLRENDARLVYGPTANDAYLLSVPAGREHTAAARLRQDSAVLLAEPLDGEPAR
jgi:anti-sigma factor RsiW